VVVHQHLPTFDFSMQAIVSKDKAGTWRQLHTKCVEKD